MAQGAGAGRVVRRGRVWILVVAALAAGVALAVQSSCDGDDGCSGDAACDDGLWCNGAETCGRSGRCLDGIGPCNDGLACNTDVCDEGSRTCAHEAVDRDGDGHGDAECGGDDCDDELESVHPGADEICNGLDDDCDTVIAEDRDGDRHWDPAVCPSEGDDCDDDDDARYPGADEICDGVDNDCDTSIDDEQDSDGDTAMDETCGGDDCDDEDPDVHPGAPELCDELDNDCDTNVDNGPGIACRPGENTSCWTTCHSIGSGECTEACRRPEGRACHPPPESCGNARDDDCDGDTDEDCPTPDAGCPGATVECCDDGIDDDCDTLTDEPECLPHGGCPIGSWRYCNPGGLGWGLQYCDESGAFWESCMESAPPAGCPVSPEGGWDEWCCAEIAATCCADTEDLDGDGLVIDSVGLDCPPDPPCV